MNPVYRRIYRVVKRIPKGRVATYGVVARLAGSPGAARTDGWAHNALPDDADVPRWRVQNACNAPCCCVKASGSHRVAP